MDVQRGGRQILFHGMGLVLVGLIWGMVVPNTPYPRLALGAHTQFVSGGMLLMVMAAVLLALRHRVGNNSMVLMVFAAWLIWPMALSEAANSFWGTNQMLPLAAEQANVKGGAAWQELVVKTTHIAAAIGLILAWILLIIGFVRPADEAAAHKTNS